MVIKITMLLPGWYFMLTSAFSTVFARAVCTSGPLCSLPPHPHVSGGLCYFLGSFQPSNPQEWCFTWSASGCLWACLAMLCLLKEMELLFHCPKRFSELFSYLERVGTCDICEWNGQSNTIWLAFSSKRIWKHTWNRDMPVRAGQLCYRSLVYAIVCGKLLSV